MQTIQAPGSHDRRIHPLLVAGLLFVLAVLARGPLVVGEGEAAFVLALPAGGIAVTFLAMRRRRTWLLLIGAVVAVEALLLTLGGVAGLALGANGPLAIAFAALGTGAAARVGAGLLRRGRGPQGEVDGLRAFVAFLVACVAGGFAGASVGSLDELLLVGSTAAWLRSLGRDLGAHVLGILLVGPAVLAFGGLWRPVAPVDPAARRARRIEWGVWLVLTALALGVVATGDAELVGDQEYLLLPPLFWAGLRFDLRTSGGALATAGFVLLAATAAGHGPFGPRAASSGDAAVAAQTFLVVAGLTTLLAGAAMADRRRSVEERLQLAARLERARDLGAVGRLAQQVAGELRAELTMVRAGCESLLRERPVDAALGAHIESVGSSLARAEAAASRLFTLGERDRPPAVDLAPLVETALEDLRRGLRPEVRLAFETEPDLPRVRIEVRDVEDVLADLVDNAERACPEGGTIHVRLGTAHVDGSTGERALQLGSGLHVVLQVEDPGIGMDRELLARAAEPGTTTYREEGALGLGLAAVRATVRSLGGDLELRSSLGDGTRALVLLPADVRVDTSASSAFRPPSRDRGTVLVVESEKPQRDFALRALEADGYEVLVAPEGEAALELAENRPGRIDLLVIDVDLPGRDGLSIAREFVDVLPGVRVVFLSSALRSTPIPARGPGASAFVQKPFTGGDLQRAVAQALRGRSPDRA